MPVFFFVREWQMFKIKCLVKEKSTEDIQFVPSMQIHISWGIRLLKFSSLLSSLRYLVVSSSNGSCSVSALVFLLY